MAEVFAARDALNDLAAAAVAARQSAEQVQATAHILNEAAAEFIHQAQMLRAMRDQISAAVRDRPRRG